MSCITTGNIRCTKCCEVLHINKSQYERWKSGKVNLNESDLMFGKTGAWVPVSYRRAKKINPYLTTKFRTSERWGGSKKNLKHEMQYFTCKYVVKSVGCSIRDTDKHPWTCKVYIGGDDYSPTCKTDINIIARSVD